MAGGKARWIRSSPLCRETRAADGPAAALQRPGATPSGRRLRPLHVFPSFNIGGAQVRFASLAAGFGSDVSHSILALRGDYEASEIVPPDAAVTYLRAPSRGPLPGRLLAYGSLLAELRPDVLLTYSWRAIEFAFAKHLRWPPAPPSGRRLRPRGSHTAAPETRMGTAVGVATEPCAGAIGDPAQPRP